MEKLKSFWNRSVTWVKENPAKTLAIGTAAVVVLAVLALAGAVT